MDDSADKEPDWGEEDWAALEARLVACASRWFWEKGCIGVDTVLPGTSMSARELAGYAIVQLLVGGKWRSLSKPAGILAYAKRTMRNKFVDLLRSPEHKKADPRSLDDLEYLMAKHSSPEAITEATEAASMVRQLMPSFTDDRQAREYLYLWLVEGMKDREDIALRMRVRARTVTDIRGRVAGKIIERLKELRVRKEPNQEVNQDKEN